MKEELRQRIAVFRYGVIADLVGDHDLDPGETERLLRDKCARHWKIPGSTRTSIGKSTIKNWVARYRRSGGKLDSLMPKPRADRGGSRAIDPETAQGLIALRRELPHVSVVLFRKEAQAREIIPPGTRIPASTLYRFLRTRGLMDKPPAPRDRRRFEADSPNDLWQSDIMHGPHVKIDGKRKKTYLIAFIDDHSRLIPHAEFYPFERLDCFLDALRKALLMRGLPRKLYVDNGPAFRSHHLATICASLGIALVHARPYQPEGKGKIERWFRTVRSRFLPVVNAHSLEELNAQLKEYLERYHDTRHRITRELPLSRFARGIECLRTAPPDLEDHFRKAARRTVAKDRTLAFKNRLYEAPVELVGKQVTLLYHPHHPERVEIVVRGKSYGFPNLVDTRVNARVKRQAGLTSIEPGETAPRFLQGDLFTGDFNHVEDTP
jgi:transposase InsO family protein